MSCTLNNNRALFARRFAALEKQLGGALDELPQSVSIQDAKNGSPTALCGGVPLHSKYDPGREATGVLSAFDPGKKAAVFLSFGLGYAPIAFARAFPGVAMVLVEPDPAFLGLAFSALDWGDVLNHGQVAFAVGASASECAALIERYGLSDVQFFESKNQSVHARGFYDELARLLERSRQKAAINMNTLERFAKLWLRNSCRNLASFERCDGVQKFFGLGAGLPFVVLAAGPSLEGVLPYLARLKERAAIVCVDTALHSCLGAGVEPDFVVLVDPQEACARHLDFLSAPSSVLITEGAAWPSVFRFGCREVVLCSSLFPLGRYFEARLGQKGKLGAGGSVATTAWDFAYSTGAREIFIAGMDLGFPHKQTHIRGSQFEERAHRTSHRLRPAETDGVASLMSANPAPSRDYLGGELLTDQRMSLFAWWFEENCARAKDAGCVTYTLTPQSMAIPGIQVADVEMLLSRPQATRQKDGFFAAAQERSALQKKSPPKASFSQVLAEFTGHLGVLSDLARSGIRLCDQAIKDRSKRAAVVQKLDGLDAQILGSSAKDAASLVFPTQRQLAQKSASLPDDPEVRPLYYSRLVYAELLGSIRQYQEYLPT